MAFKWDKLTVKSQEAVQAAASTAAENGNPEVLPMHLLAALLEDESGLREWYDGLTEYWRREIGKWVMDVKSDEARMRRAEQMAERMLSTMEAEAELPPVVERACRARPRARASWRSHREGR